MPEAPTSFELAKLSYGEVLDATKHQDDKIGRTLGAIAFFTGGVIAFLDRDVVVVRYQFGTRAIPLIAVALGAFLVLAALSALLFVVASSSPLTVPRRRPTSTGTSSSHLFFLDIGPQAHDAWLESWEDPYVIAAVQSDLVSETHHIAERATAKYRRSEEAAALLLLGMPFFIATVLLAIDANATQVATPRIEWTFARRLMIAVAFGAIALALVYFEATKRPGLRQTLVFYPTFVMLVICGSDHPVSLTATAVIGLLATDAFQSMFLLDDKRTLRTNAVVAFGIAITTGAVIAASTSRHLVQLAAGTGMLTLLPMQAVLQEGWSILSRPALTGRTAAGRLLRRTNSLARSR